jgi:hypothetical protein
VHTISAKPGDVLRPLQQALQPARPRGVLIEKIALRLTATCDENAEQPSARSREIAAALPFRVDIEADESLELRQDIRIRFEAQPQAWREDEILPSMSYPPSNQKLCHDREDRDYKRQGS